MKFLHGYPYHALGSVTVASLSQNDLSTAVSEYINKAQAAKSSEQLQNAFSQMCQNLGLVSPEYLALMDKNLETLMSLSIPGDTDESVRASNIFNFCMDLVLRLRVANLLIEKNQQELEEKEKDTVNNLLKYVRQAVEYNRGLNNNMLPIEVNQIPPDSSGSPPKAVEEVDLSEAMDDGTNSTPDVVDNKVDKEVAAKPSSSPEEEKGMSTNKKIGLVLLGGGVLAIGGLLYLASKNKSRKMAPT